jgi:hypothetical protein
MSGLGAASPVSSCRHDEQGQQIDRHFEALTMQEA